MHVHYANLIMVNGGVWRFSVASNVFLFWLLAVQGVNLGKLGNWTNPA